MLGGTSNSMILYISLGVIYKFIEGVPHVFMQIRDEEGPFYGKWEFPGGNIEEGETPEEAIIREVEEEVGIKVSKPFRLDSKREEFDTKSIIFFTHLFQNKQSYELENWFNVFDDSYFNDIPPANIDLINKLRKFFGEDEKTFKEFEKFLWP